MQAITVFAFLAVVGYASAGNLFAGQAVIAGPTLVRSSPVVTYAAAPAVVAAPRVVAYAAAPRVVTYAAAPRVVSYAAAPAVAYASAPVLRAQPVLSYAAAPAVVSQPAIYKTGPVLAAPLAYKTHGAVLL